MLRWIRFATSLSLIALAFALPAALSAENPPPSVQVELIHEENAIQAGRPFWVAVRLHISDGYHAYWKNPGDSGMPTSIQWTLPEGFTASSLEWPVPQKFNVDSLIGFGYEGATFFLAQITPPKTLSDKPIELATNVQWLVCSDEQCVPGNSEAKASIPTTTKTPQLHPQWSSMIVDARKKLPAKAEKIQVVSKEALIEVMLDLPLHDNISVSFFPEEKHVIDHKTEPTLRRHPETNQLLVTLKKAEQVKSKALKGVMVVSDKNESSRILHAFDINAPIAGESNIAMADGTVEAGIVPDFVPNAEEIPVSGGLLTALFLAFLGGMILNLMPCVLPVVSFKILSFVKMAGQDRKKILKHGFAFFAGVMISFWALAAMLLLLQAYGKTVGWGFQLQEPLFVAILAAILFVFGLSLFGVLEAGAFLTTLAGQAQAKNISQGYVGSFLSGVLATAVATPCTGPFLGSAIGFAMTVPALEAMLIFTFLGLGMALPYLLLSAYPNYLKYLPKPGPWMETFKELMGFLMLATALWLIWVFSAQTSSFAVVLMLAGFFCLSISCWIYGKWGSPVNSRLSRILSLIVALSIVFVGAKFILVSTELPPETEIVADAHVAGAWEKFSPERVAELQAQGTPVLIDFTAKWCLICQANHIAMSTDSVSKALQEKGVVKMKADWTKNDPVITQELRKFGRNGVPLYLLYGSDASKPPAILPQVLTPDGVLKHLEEL